MAQIPVTKVRFFIPKDSSEALVARLLEDGSVQLIEERASEELSVDVQEIFDHRSYSARLDDAIEFLSQYQKESDPLKAMFEGTKIITTDAKIQELSQSYETERVLTSVHEVQTALVAARANDKALDDEERTIRSWERLNFPLSDVSDSDSTVVFPLHGTQRELDVLEKNLAEITQSYAERVGDSALLIVAHRDAKEAVENLFRETDIELLKLPDTTETAAEALSRISDSKVQLEKETAQLEEKAASLAASELPSLKQISDRARWSATEKDTAATIPHSDTVSVFDAWTPAPTWPLLQETLNKEFSAIAFETLTVGEEETPPTIIANRGFAQPYEFITRLYGVPSHKDLDPTPFLSAFFFIFFGLCLSDVGYGSTLMALTGFVLLRYKVIGGMRQLLTTLFFGGLGAALVGLIYGGYFGVPAATISPLLAKLQLFDPIGDPMPVFFLALAFGVIHVMFGITLDIVRAAKNNDLMNGMFNNVPWLLMFLILITYIISQTGLLPESVSTAIAATWSWFAIGAAVLISVSQARLGKGIIDMALKGVLALYGGVNYFSDILSYSRLLALGLSTSALGFSVNLIAQIVGGESLGIGTIFAILVLIAGHTLNITLSTLGAFIHSSRLQYVEFFGKFLTGTGKPFSPLMREKKHTILLPESPG